MSESSSSGDVPFDNFVPFKDDLGRVTYVPVKNPIEVCINPRCKAHNSAVDDPREGIRVCTKCGTIQHQSILDNRATNRDIDPSSYKTRGAGRSRRDRSEARESVSSAGAKRKAVLPQALRKEFHQKSKAGELNVHERAHQKSTAFLEAAEKAFNTILTWEWFGMHFHHSDEYLERAEKSKNLTYHFSKHTLQKIFRFACQIPQAAWTIHDRAMGATYHAAAGIYLACMHFDIPITISHIATCIMDTGMNSSSKSTTPLNVYRVERKISSCVERVTAKGFFPELKLSYIDGVSYIIRSMLKFPDVPRALPVLARMRRGPDGTMSRGKPSLTKMQAELVEMSYEKRCKLMPCPTPERHQDFVKECLKVWSTFVRYCDEDLRSVRSRVVRDRVTNGAVTQKTAEQKESVEAHRYLGGSRRTKKIPGICEPAVGHFTANPNRLAVAVIMFVALRPGAAKRYGRFYWPYFRYKTCQMNRLKKKITETLVRHNNLMVGAIRNAPKPVKRKRRGQTGVEAAARAAVQAIHTPPRDMYKLSDFGFYPEPVMKRQKVRKKKASSLL